MKLMIRTSIAVLGMAVVGAVAGPADALPDLQIYIEGATYDGPSETWVLTTAGSFDLWVIGDVGDKGAINNVFLSVAFASGLSPIITLTPTTTGGFQGFTDPSTPGAATLVANPMSDVPGGVANCGLNGTNGNLPCLSDGTSLPSHDIYGAGTDWREFALGNFTLTDSPTADFNGATVPPVPDAAKVGQINVYTVSITGVPTTTVFHFDTFDTVVGANHASNAPFSHDGETTGSTTSVPAPSTLTLLGLGIVAARLGGRVGTRGPRLS
jgi:hypothetical protein